MTTEPPESSDATASEFDWLTLDDGEQRQWSGNPHVYSIVPALIVGLPLALLLIGIPIVVGAYRIVYENCSALYPLPARTSRSSALAEEGGLAPQFS
jgi:hypothetical protein